ncbi:MAG TPA: FKBP-type peptidyl-prolyl cis-trans isomerase [Streptosporangiaceae bacterium]
MRRLIAVFLAPLAVTAALAGCGSATTATTSANSSVKVTGAVGTEATVHIPATKASSGLVTKTLVQGHGAKLSPQDSYLANFDVYVWSGKTSKLLYSSYKGTAQSPPAPQMFPVTLGSQLSGLETAVKNQRAGSRILAVLPPKYGYGSQGNSQIGVKPTDTMVWVVDVVQAFPPNASATGQHVSDGGGKLPTISATPGAAPTIKVPKSAPPSKLVVQTLIKGTGAPVKANQNIVVRYVASIWRTGQVFNNNWPSPTQPTAPPTLFSLSRVIPGFSTGLVGVPVGSRVMLVIPPAEGYGKAGSAQAGIKGTDTLVFVVDVLAAA